MHYHYLLILNLQQSRTHFGKFKCVKFLFFCFFYWHVGHNKSVNTVCMNHANNLVMTSSADQTVKLWFPGHFEPILNISHYKNSLSEEKPHDPVKTIFCSYFVMKIVYVYLLPVMYFLCFYLRTTSHLAKESVELYFTSMTSLFYFLMAILCVCINIISIRQRMT